MISHITGTVLECAEKYAIISANGIGYKIFCPPETMFIMENAGTSPVSLWTHLVVREDALTLYGFTDRKDLTLFELLITVSGIGPKTAQGVLSAAGARSVRYAIAHEDPTPLTKVSGVGKKVAEKIVLELKGKIILTKEESADGSSRDESDAVLALASLGYSERDVRTAIKLAPKEMTKTQDLVKFALKNLGKK
jgi:Holliday junction DNA helicase RuvA